MSFISKIQIASHPVSGSIKIFMQKIEVIPEGMAKPGKDICLLHDKVDMIGGGVTIS